MLLNQTEITEVAPHKFYSFILNLIQIYFCTYFLILELTKDVKEETKDEKMVLITLFIQLGLAIFYILYLKLNNDLNSVGIMAFCFLLELSAFTWTQLFIYQIEQPALLVAWLRVNSYVIALKFFHLLLLNKMKRNFDGQLMTKAIYCAQRNQK